MTRRQRRKKRQRAQEQAAFLDRQRAAAPGREVYGTLSLRLDAGGRPATLDEAARSVEITAATEAPVTMFDWQREEFIDEVLLMSGCRLPATGKVPMLDTHGRWDTSTVIGSCRELRVAGDKLLARAVFSALPEGDKPFTKLREGHLTDFSAGYRVHQYTRIPRGETETVAGRAFTGPLLVATDWEVREISICPVGADSNAKARAEAKPQKEEDAMNERLRKFLEARGLAKDAGEDEAWRFLEKLETPGEDEDQGEARRQDQAANQAPAAQTVPGETRSAAPQPQDAERAARDAVRAERERTAEIRGLCTRFGAADLADSLINEGRSVTEAKDAVLGHLESRAPVAMPGMRVEMGMDERDKFRAAGRDSLLLRGGLRVSTPAPGAVDLRGLTLREMARECLTRAGHRSPGGVMEMVGRALTSSDFPLLLEDSARQSLFAGFESARETWPVWAATGSVSDFKIHSKGRVSETDDLDEIPEHGEYKYGDLDESREQYQIATYGKMLSISRQAIINDDLGALTGIPAKHGEAAARKIGDIVYAVITANGNMGDNVALFHASTHGNLASSGGIPGIVTLSAAIKAMKLQKDLKEQRRLNIRPEFFLAPVALEGSCEQMFRSTLEGTQSKPNMVNPYSGDYFTRIYEPRLDDDSATAWYLFGPKGKTVTVYFLDGNQTPWLDTRQGWNVDGVEYKVRIDAGAMAEDWRAAYKNPGASS